MPLKDILKTLRYKAGYTQSQVADRVGVSMQGYQKWEYGQSIPSPDKIKPLAAALDVPPDAIEAQLAHSVGGTVRAVYNHAQYLPIRRVMMQWYADYLNALRDGQPAPPMPPH